MGRKIPATQYPSGAERDYYRALLNAINQWFAELAQAIAQELALTRAAGRFDSPFEGLFDVARDRWEQRIAGLVVMARGIAQQVQRVVDRSFARQLNAATPKAKARMFGVSFSAGFLPFGDLQGEIDTFTRQNVLLIKDIGEKAARDIEIAVVDAVSKGVKTRDLAKLLKEQQGYTQKRAALIARDQIGKLNGNLNRTRMQAAGVTQYRWQTMEDRRVRPKHVALNGEIRTWDQSPRPGEEIRCRCSPQPIFTDADFGI